MAQWGLVGWSLSFSNHNIRMARSPSKVFNLQASFQYGPSGPYLSGRSSASHKQIQLRSSWIRIRLYSTYSSFSTPSTLQNLCNAALSPHRNNDYANKRLRHRTNLHTPRSASVHLEQKRFPAQLKLVEWNPFATFLWGSEHRATESDSHRFSNYMIPSWWLQAIRVSSECFYQ